MRTTKIAVGQATEVVRAITALAARLRTERKGGLSLNETAVLGRLRRHGAMTPGEVAGQLRMLPQSLTRTFAALEEAGFVSRSPDPADGRQSLLACTPAGGAALRTEFHGRGRWLAENAPRALSDEEWGQVVAAAALLERLAAVDATVAAVER